MALADFAPELCEGCGRPLTDNDPAGDWCATCLRLLDWGAEEPDDAEPELVPVPRDDPSEVITAADLGLAIGPPAPAATSWDPVDLGEILAGDYVAPAPTMLARDDGRCLLYPGRNHWVSAEPEALKTWFALLACAEQIAVAHSALYMDFESNAAEIVGRLRALGVEPDAIRERFIYVRPDEPLVGGAVAALDAALARKPTLTVIDGVTEAFAVQGLSPLDNAEVASWLEILPRRILRAGSTSLALDHVVKDKEQRGRYAIGAQHKLAGVDVAYTLEVVEPFGRGRDGVVTVKVQKDRPGGVREFAQDAVVATLRATSLAGGRVSLALELPDAQTASATFRPTLVMERVSRYVEGAPGASQADIETNVSGRSAVIRKAIQVLIEEGHLLREREGVAWRHTVSRPFRQDAEAAISSTRPISSQLVPDEPTGVLVHSSRPFKGEDEDGTRTTAQDSATRPAETATTHERGRAPSDDDLKPRPGESFEDWEARAEAMFGGEVR
ncbi:MAG: AAA family ATPase [Solirubrobacteraceae bacterium]